MDSLFLVKPGIREFAETEVVFTDGTEVEMDAVIRATGFHRRIAGSRTDQMGRCFRLWFMSFHPELSLVMGLCCLRWVSLSTQTTQRKSPCFQSTV